ncbi:YIF1-domain-containing protein [Ramicandelaber brevisporus]|nr:YIF1-domain-containing protein [Ramicandelaber brevisporus]
MSFYHDPSDQQLYSEYRPPSTVSVSSVSSGPVLHHPTPQHAPGVRAQGGTAFLPARGSEHYSGNTNNTTTSNNNNSSNNVHSGTNNSYDSHQQYYQSHQEAQASHGYYGGSGSEYSAHGSGSGSGTGGGMSHRQHHGYHPQQQQQQQHDQQQHDQQGYYQQSHYDASQQYQSPHQQPQHGQMYGFAPTPAHDSAIPSASTTNAPHMPATFADVQQQFQEWQHNPAAQLGMHFASNAMTTGIHTVEQNLNKYVNMSQLKTYFAVTNSYVFHKLRLILLPIRHPRWTRIPLRSDQTGEVVGFRPPRDDINSPDLYIPLMALVTYVLLAAAGPVLMLRLNGHDLKFQPALFGTSFSTALGVVLAEVVYFKVMLYIFNIASELTLLDLVAYMGYKFVGVDALLVAQFLGIKAWLPWAYTALSVMLLGSFAFFLMRSMRYGVLPDSASVTATTGIHGRSRRIYLLFSIAVLFQIISFVILMWSSNIDSGSGGNTKTESSSSYKPPYGRPAHN